MEKSRLYHFHWYTKYGYEDGKKKFSSNCGHVEELAAGICLHCGLILYTDYMKLSPLVWQWHIDIN